jgi:hypothetical protein
LTKEKNPRRDLKRDEKTAARFPAEDELTSGIINMACTKEIPIWLVLALQVQ